MNDRNENLRKLGELIKDVRVAMLTTVAADGRVVSRPVATQDAEFDGDLWFATDIRSGKVREIEGNPHVNVAYAAPGDNTFVSVAGRASLVRDRAKIHELWSAPMKVYFPEGKDDPNLCLVRVEAESAEYWDGPGTLVGKALYLITAAATDDPEAMSDNERIDLRSR